MELRKSILAYHAVGPCPNGDRLHNCLCVSRDAFAAQMEFLARHRRVVPLDDLIQGPLRPGPPAVAITFDDGYRNVLANAAPVMARHGFVATMFVPTAWIGGNNMWDAGTQCFPLEIMDEADLRDAERQGVAVESHGHAHIDLERADASVVAEDLRQSVLRLTEVLGRRPRYLAYPFGRQSPATQAAAQAAGFEDAFLFDELEIGPFGRERVSVDGHEGWARLRLKTAGGYLARRRSPLGRMVAGLVRRVAPRPGPLLEAGFDGSGHRRV